MSEPKVEGVEVPWDRLASDVLRRVVEEFVTREGTDYGEASFSLDDKVGHVLAQLRRGEAAIVFDPGTETLDIISRRGR